MNLLDLFILLPICYFAYKGFVSGFIKEVLGIVGIVFAVFIAFQYMKPVSNIISPLFDSPDNATIVAGIFLFIVIIVITQLLAYASKRFLELLSINFINRIAGFCFGMLKSGIVVSAFLLLLAGFNMPAEDTREESLTYPMVLVLAPATFNAVATVVPGIESFIITIEEAIEENNPIRTLPIFENLTL